MSKAYLLAYSPTLGTQDQVKGYLNSIPEITHWRRDMPHSFYVISDLSADGLAQKLREMSHGRGRFVFVEFSGNDQGWLTGGSWYLINHKNYQPKGK